MDRRKIRSRARLAKQLIEIYPIVPTALARLPELSNNLFFSWHRPTRALFEDLDPELWQQTGGNPRLMLRCINQENLDRAAANAEYLQRYGQVLTSFDAYLAAPPPRADEPLIAYFCAEYGFHESFPIYSGGLGILAGDHCKAASDERLNFVAVGLLYNEGYFIQAVDSDGVQHANYNDTDPRDLPVDAVRDEQGQWLQVRVPIAGRSVCARVWKARVGRVSVYLLDTNCAENVAEDRDITRRLYGGDAAIRIRQEMILGLGGVRALRALGLQPATWHMNEGHAAFLILELARESIGRGLDFSAALEATAAQCVFTTHTPVSAGHDAFDTALFTHCFQEFVPELNVPMERVLALGLAPHAPSAFNMTHLALHGARRMNGVSRIHGQVSARLCADHWPEVAPEDNPVGYVTNGVHVPTFLAQTWSRFLDDKLGPQWRDRMSDGGFWRALEQVPDEEFWRTAQSIKSRMLAGVRLRLQREYAAKNLSQAQLRRVTRLLDPERPQILTLGFARRFATYKRAALMMRDRARLARLVHDPERPVLFLFAGKAHPADQPGQQVLREIKQLMLTPEFAGHLVFLEDYDLQLARWLVTGVDVWLNNPVAPLEASGTSGIKAAVNGRLNLSILDGWWAEAFDEHNGWGIPGANVQDPNRRDELDSAAMLDTLEEEVVPLYYARNGGGFSSEWVRRCKHAMASVIPHFNMGRVVQDYARGLYYPAASHHQRIMQGGQEAVAAFAGWKQRIRERWGGVHLRRLSEPPRELPRGGQLNVRVAAALNGLGERDVRVEFLARRVLPQSRSELPALSSFRSEPDDAWRVALRATGEIDSDGSHIYELQARPPASGQFAYEIRIHPTHDLLAHPMELGLLKRL
ncbi:MAG: alpha-glucan family phosphorylase [Steroidobacteraceae bacterium]